MKLAILFVMLLFGCNCNCPPQPPTDTAPVPKYSNWEDGYRSRLNIVCIEGHSYYYARRDGAILAIKLDDDGKPVKCTAEIEKESR